uniref:Uncharacterized protein n=1 Tax=Mus spicilegus TaxID=10103 RepID=A0A8C6GCR2_MUSSI
MMGPRWQPLKMWWWSLSSTAWVSWASSAQEMTMPEATGDTWTKWLPYTGSSRTLPTLEAILTGSLFLASLQVTQVFLHMLCPPCPKGSSMVPSWRVGWPCCLTLSPTPLRWSIP